MSTLGNVLEGTLVRLNQTDIYARILKKSSGGVVVETDTGKTIWSPDAVVTIVSEKEKTKPPVKPAIIPPQTAPIPSGTASKQKPDKPPKQKTKAENQAAPKRKEKNQNTSKPNEYDSFGVRIGTQANRINNILLQVKKDVTAAVIISHDATIKESSANSHLARMASDGLIAIRKEGKTRYYSLIPKKKG